MSNVQFTQNGAFSQPPFFGLTPSQFLTDMWFWGDSCDPEGLPTANLTQRRDSHAEALISLNRKSPEYAANLAQARYYDLLLRMRTGGEKLN